MFQSNHRHLPPYLFSLSSTLSLLQISFGTDSSQIDMRHSASHTVCTPLGGLLSGLQNQGEAYLIPSFYWMAASTNEHQLPSKQALMPVCSLETIATL